MASAALSGRRVLVVEDVLLVADMIAEALTNVGCEIVGPVARRERGLVLAREMSIECAVLDINLDGEPSFPIAEVLQERGIPFLFVTGYGAETVMPEPLRAVPRLAKPFHVHELLAALTGCCDTTGTG